MRQTWVKSTQLTQCGNRSTILVPMNSVLAMYSLAGGEEHFCHISKASGKQPYAGNINTASITLTISNEVLFGDGYLSFPAGIALSKCFE